MHQTQTQKAEAFAQIDKLSDLIDVALEDLEAIEETPGYEIDMGLWHEGHEHRHMCAVCAAGAIMANRLGADPNFSKEPRNFSPRVRGRLEAVNDLRGGRVGEAAWRLGMSCNKHRKFDRCITHYDMDRNKFFEEMRFLAHDLRRAGR